MEIGIKIFIENHEYNIRIVLSWEGTKYRIDMGRVEIWS